MIISETEYFKIFTTFANEGYVEAKDAIQDSIPRSEKREYKRKPVSEKEKLIGDVLQTIFAQKDMLYNLIIKDPSKKELFIDSNDNPVHQYSRGIKDLIFQRVIVAYTGFVKQPPNTIMSNYEELFNDMIVFLLNKVYPDKKISTKTSATQKDRLEGEEKKLDKILKKFFDISAQRKLSYKNVFETKKYKAESVRLLDQTLTQVEIKEDLNFLDSLDTKTRRKMSSIYETLMQTKRSGNTRTFDVKIEGSSIIGKMDLKSLEDRSKIYDYWKDKHDEYDDFKTAYMTFYDLVKDMAFVGELKEVMSEIIGNRQREAIENDEFNYIADFKPMPMSTVIKKEKHIVLFEQILNKHDLLGVLEEKNDELEESSDNLLDNKIRTLYDEKGNSLGNTAEVDAGKVKGKIDVDEIKSLGRTLSALVKTEVDPIYYIQFDDKAFTKPSPVFTDELMRLKKLLLIEGSKYEAVLDVDIDDLILKYFNALEESASDVSRDEYYLPISSTTASKLLRTTPYSSKNKGPSKEMDGRIKGIVKFLTAFSKLYEPDSFASVAPTKTKTRSKTMSSKGSDTTGLIEPLIENLGSSPSSKKPANQNKQLSKISKELGDLLEEINEFFVKPMDSSFVPFEDKFGIDIESSERRIFRIIATHTEGDDIYSHMMGRQQEVGYVAYAPRHIKRLTNFIRKETTPKRLQNVRGIFDLMNEGRKIISLIADIDKNDKTKSSDVAGEFGVKLYNILVLNNLTEEYKRYFSESSPINPKGNFPDKDGKTPREWYLLRGGDNDIKDKSLILPNTSYRMIIDDIYNNSSLEDTYTGEMRGDDKGSTIYSDFIKVINDTKNKPDTLERKMLKAHDNIRKMLGKPIYYNISSLEEYDHINAAIDIMKVDYNVDISATEIVSIVNEVDSFGEIGIKHGVPKESVYFLKANFR